MTEYHTLFREMNVGDNPLYSHDDIGVARLFYDVHSDSIRYIVEAKAWYIYDGTRWLSDSGSLRVMELCKSFVRAFCEYAQEVHGDDAVFIKYAEKLKTRRRREGILCDARSIEPMSLSAFDTNKWLLNCSNGTVNLQDFCLQPHRPEDYITKIARVKYDLAARCPRWERFVEEIMCGDADTALYLQKALGYSLTGDTSLECFFILYGNTTRNGKSTLSETVAYIMGDYARTIQPQTLARRPPSGAAASPDTARLKGARLVNMPEPEKGLELNIALVKQLTGGDTYTGRFLNENPVEFAPEFKIFINTNHLPRTSDDTIFASGRVKLIPFERHFKPEEQDTGLKKLFRKGANKSAVLNWLIAGYRLMLDAGFDLPQKVIDAIKSYRLETDIIGTFLAENTEPKEKSRLSTSELYTHYTQWADAYGYKPVLNNRSFVGELRRRCDVRKGNQSNVVVGLALI
jgi:putative DNA primase/helicase